MQVFSSLGIVFSYIITGSIMLFFLYRAINNARSKDKNPRPGPHRRNRSKLIARLTERIKAGIVASDNKLIDSGRVELTPPVDAGSDVPVAPGVEVAVIDDGASAHGIVVAEWNTLGLPLTSEVQVVEMIAMEVRATLSSPGISQRVDPVSSDFLNSTTGWPSVTHALMQPFDSTETDLHATTS